MPTCYNKFREHLPSCYVNFIESNEGWVGDLGDELGYVVLWSRGSLEEQWTGYEIPQYLSDRWFPFGSNGGGEMLCFDLASHSDTVFWIPFIGMSDEEAMEQSFKFADVVQAIRYSKKHD